MTKENETTTYTVHRIGERVVYNPNPKLKLALQAANTEIWDRLIRNPDFLSLYSEQRVVHGFVRKRNVATHARVHRNAQTLIQLDIRHAYPSTPADKVVEELAKIHVQAELVDFIADNAFVDGVLPTGFPTSPTLFNVVMLPVDKDLVKFADRGGMKYSRYADDLAFSAQAGYVSPKVNAEIQEIIKDHGYDTHKIRAAHPQRYPVGVCGITLYQGTLTIPERTMRRIRGQVHRSLHLEKPPEVERALGLMAKVIAIRRRMPDSMDADWQLAKELAAKMRSAGLL